MDGGVRLVDHLRTRAEQAPEAVAVVDGARRVSYGELWDLTAAVVASLRDRGIGLGDRVLCIMSNRLEVYAVFYALSALGAVCVPRCHRLSVTSAHSLASLQPKAVFASDIEDLEMLRALLPESLAICVGPRADGAIDFDTLVAGERPPFHAEGSAGDVRAIVFTSGTTGEPRGVQVSERNLLVPTAALAQRLECSAQDVFLVPMPLVQMFGIVAGLVMPIISGGRAVLLARHDSADALRLVQDERVTVHLGVPAMFIRELDHLASAAEAHDLSSLRTGLMAGSYCPPDLIRRLASVMGVDVNIGYGSTETVNVSMTSPRDSAELRATTVGRPSAGCEVRIVDRSGSPLPAGAPGELLSRGPGTMIGYLNHPEETAAVIDAEGWAHSGDLATVGTDGYIRIIGRIKDLIIRGGNNVSPLEVERVIADHPAVAEVVVLGIPDRVLGEVIHAWVTERPGGGVTEGALRAWVRGRLERFKCPEAFHIERDLPRMAGGKVDRAALRDSLRSAK